MTREDLLPIVWNQIETKGYMPTYIQNYGAYIYTSIDTIEEIILGEEYSETIEWMSTEDFEDAVGWIPFKAAIGARRWSRSTWIVARIRHATTWNQENADLFLAIDKKFV